MFGPGPSNRVVYDICSSRDGKLLLSQGGINDYRHSRIAENFESRFTGVSCDDLQQEAIPCFETVVTEYSDVATLRGNFTLGELAQREIFEMTHLAVGKVAPEINGVRARSRRCNPP